MSRKSQEEVTTEYWSKLFSQSSPSMKKDTNKEGPHNKEENEVEDLVEEWLLHQNTEIRSRWRIHCRCFPGISQATRNQTSLKGRIEQSLTWPEALTSNHTIPPTVSTQLTVHGNLFTMTVIALFYQKFWPKVGTLVTHACLRYLNDGRMITDNTIIGFECIHSLRQ
ncbi:hypothetical protein ACOSQ4_018080 [Xanthoceras sorbifolium]